jgi:hypothetical protein
MFGGVRHNRSHYSRPKFSIISENSTRSLRHTCIIKFPYENICRMRCISAGALDRRDGKFRICSFSLVFHSGDGAVIHSAPYRSMEILVPMSISCKINQSSPRNPHFITSAEFKKKLHKQANKTLFRGATSLDSSGFRHRFDATYLVAVPRD